MKTILSLMTVAILFGSCNSGGGGGKKDTVVVRDTVNVVSNKPAHHRHHTEEGSATPGQPASDAGSASTSASAPQPATQVSQPEASRKKGWSAAAKDATIGGAAGAVAGALLDKNNRVVGGLLGAAVGGGAGYLIGRKRDRKTGRVVKHQPVQYNYASNQ